MADNWSKNGSLYRRNPLAYPAGRTPGFDQSHPAAKNCYFSVIPGGGPNFINLLTGVRLGVLSGTTPPVPSIGAIGPGLLNNDSAGQQLGLSFSKTVSAVTMAAIFVANDGPGTGLYQSLVIYGPNGNGLFVRTAGEFVIGVPASVNLTLIPVPGHIYFGVWSVAFTAAGEYYGVMKDLTTGKVFTASGTQAQTTAPSAITNFSTMEDGFGSHCPAPVAAGMFADVFLSREQLLQWANDPWAFWYPRQIFNIVSLTAAASTSNFAVFSTPYDDNRTVTQMIGY